MDQDANDELENSFFNVDSIRLKDDRDKTLLTGFFCSKVTEEITNSC